MSEVAGRSELNMKRNGSNTGHHGYNEIKVVKE